MNLQQAQKKYEKIDWYTQAAAIKPLYISYPWYACTSFKINDRLTPVRYEILALLNNNFMQDYLSKRSLEKISKYYYAKQKKDHQFIQKHYQRWQKKYVTQLFNESQCILQSALKNYSTPQLLKLFEQFSKSYLDFWQEAIFLDAFDYYGETILEKALLKENKNITAEDLEVLLTPPEPSFIQKERLDLLSVKTRLIASQQKLKDHQRKYYWLHNDYAVIKSLPINYFKKNLQKIDLKQEKALKKELALLNNRKARVKKKYKLSKTLKNTLDFMALLGTFRDVRKSYQQMTAAPLKKLAKEIAKRAELPVNTVENCFFWEMKSIFKYNKLQLNTINKRDTGGTFFMNVYRDKHEALYGKPAHILHRHLQKIISKQSGLKGMPACAGKVTGKVRVISNVPDMDKFKQGEILVTNNTTPEFVPLMKKAKAIITEQGGVTTHAAIVSRELNVPCVIGVKNVVRILKNGNKVELNANKGKIKIL